MSAYRKSIAIIVLVLIIIASSLFVYMGRSGFLAVFFRKSRLHNVYDNSIYPWRNLCPSLDVNEWRDYLAGAAAGYPGGRERKLVQLEGGLFDTISRVESEVGLNGSNALIHALYNYVCFEKIFKQVVDTLEANSNNEYYLVYVDQDGFTLKKVKMKNYVGLFKKTLYYISGLCEDLDDFFYFEIKDVIDEIIKLYEEGNIDLLKHIGYNPIYARNMNVYGLEEPTTTTISLFMYEDPRFIILQYINGLAEGVIDWSDGIFKAWSHTILYDKLYGNLIYVLELVSKGRNFSISEYGEDGNLYPLIWLDDIKNARGNQLELWVFLNKTMLENNGYSGVFLVEKVIGGLLHVYRGYAGEKGLCFKISVSAVKKNDGIGLALAPLKREENTSCLRGFDENVSRIMEAVRENNVSMAWLYTIRFWFPNDIVFRVFNSKTVQDLLAASGLPSGTTLESVLKPWTLYFVAKHRYVLILWGYYYDPETGSFKNIFAPLIEEMIRRLENK